ncbi:RING finger protein 43 [Cricetulus griseus]|uniref:RING finger protein 43 n=1 Tax=Cricetulus griseus TaxID=10029 RepID=A0A061HY81_CRIGR|nr:RING finger protein 43 [Cricetulus griseus]
MSGGQQLQLAALWPWLLMATLHAGFGRTGLVLAAAVESERSAEQKAIIRVIPLKVDPTGKLNLTLEVEKTPGVVFSLQSLLHKFTVYQNQL